MTRNPRRSAPASRKPPKKADPPRRTSTSRGRSAAQRTSAKNTSSRPRKVARGTFQAARCLWAAVTALVLAALLFEPTMVWTLGVGIFMIAAAEFSGLWLVVVGYGLACIPAVFGLLVATGRFWTSLTHALWIGALYAVLGFLFLDRILGVLSPYGW